MASASNLQTDFRGGEWSQTAQGRMDDKEYHRALSVCRNAYPTEVGAWTRRPGTRWLATTLGAGFAWLIAFHFSQATPYVMELTDGALRFFAGPNLVLTADVQDVASVSTATPAVVTTKAADGWTTGDQVMFLLPPTGVDTTLASGIVGRQFAITTLTATTFSLADPISGIGLDGTTVTLPPGTSIGRVLALVTPYTAAQLPYVRGVQTETLANNVLQGQVVLLHNAVAPQLVTNTVADTGDAFAQFSIGAASFSDGPYFDPVAGTVSVNALSGTITLSAAPASTFVATDVGRHVRLYSEPGAWAVGTAYGVGTSVKYTDGNYYTAIAASTGKAPNQYPTLWTLNPAAAIWSWGVIASYISGTSVTVTLRGPALLYTGSVTTWRLGLYSATTGYPSCGCFHEGRLWLAGAQGNRIDASNSNDTLNFAPTASDGSVGDANAISYIFNADDVNPILWITPDHSGLVAGTKGGEWSITASQLNDPLTPTSIQAHRVTKYKCANTEPVRAGVSLLFIQAQQKRLIEYTSDAFSGKFLGRNVSEKAEHITSPGIAQIAYQQDLVPIVWARMSDGTLGGMLYKRESSFTAEPPVFTAWHSHTLGSGCLIESIVTGPNADGTLETLTMSVLDPVTGVRHIEMLADTFVETDTIGQAWHLDGAMPPSGIVEDTTNNTITFTGLYTLAGQSVTAWVAGLDAGDYTIGTDGSITLSLGTPSLLTDAYLQTWVGAQTTAYDVPVLRKVTVVDPSPGNKSIQSYIDASVVTGTASTSGFIYDPARDRVIVCSSGSGATAGIEVFKASTGAFLAGITAPDLFTKVNKYPYFRFKDPSSKTIQGPYGIDGHGNLYFPSDLRNQCVLREVNFSNLADIHISASFGIGGNAFVSNDTHIVVPGNSCAVTAGGDDFMLFTGAVANTPVTILRCNQSQSKRYNNTGLTTLVGSYSITEAGADCCSGFQTWSGKKARGTAYVLGHTNNDLASTARINIYQAVVKSGTNNLFPTASMVVIGPGVQPSDVDGTWTHFGAVRGPVFDKTDGNLLVWAKTTDAVANTAYVLKISTSTGLVMWATAVGGTPNNRTGLVNTNVQYGTVAWLVAGTLYTCNTSTGVVTTATIAGTSGSFAQCSDDSNGTLFACGTYLSTAPGAPVPLNGTVSFATQSYFRLQGIGFGQAVAMQTAVGGIASIPTVFGYAFTSQGQRVRPAEGAEVGAKNGPAFAKTRRNHKAGFQVVQTQGLSIGSQLVDLTTVRPLVLKTDTVNVNAANVLFSGVARQEVDDAYSFDGMLAWRISRPYPCIITAVGGFLETQDI